MKDWNHLVSAALVGTGNRNIAETDPDSPAADLLSKVDQTEKERCLLTRSGIVSVAQLAGYKPDERNESTQIEPAEEETTALCSGLAAGMLISLLAANDVETAADWLRTAARKQRRIPPERLPEILDFGHKHRNLRDAILEVIGRRGSWLARFNPGWEYASGQPPHINTWEESKVSEVWETGTLQDRLALLEALRVMDADQARRLVEGTWDTDPVETRARFLSLFQPGLSLADEPFLEAALDDKRKEIRQASASLLVLLEGSAFSHRMAERVSPLITLRRSLLGGESIEVQLPGEWDTAMGRDGISAKPAKDSGYGDRAWLLRQIVACVPPSWWQREFNRSPAQLIQAASKNEDWKNVLLCGWTSAADIQNDSAWKEALVWFALDNPKSAPKEANRPVLPSLTDMSSDRLESLLRHMMAVMQNDRTERVLQILETRTGDWSAALSRIAVEVAFEDIRRSKHGMASWHAGRLLQLAGVYGPATPLEEFEVMWQGQAQANGIKSSTVDKFLEKLRFRQEMYRALEEEQ